jgi:hypothetical protein
LSRGTAQLSNPVNRRSAIVEIMLDFRPRRADLFYLLAVRQFPAAV